MLIRQLNHEHMQYRYDFVFKQGKATKFIDRDFYKWSNPPFIFELEFIC